MALLITGSVFGFAAFAAALVLQFRLPGWIWLAGLQRFPADRFAQVDTPRLRRRLSILMYILSVGLLAGSILLAVRAVSASILLTLYFLLVLAVLNACWFFYRHFDRNEYAPRVRRSGRIFLVLLDLCIIVFALLVVL
jgi:hypothetical protein